MTAADGPADQPTPDLPAAGAPGADQSVDVSAADATGAEPQPASLDPDSYVEGGESLGGTAGIGGAG